VVSPSLLSSFDFVVNGDSCFVVDVVDVLCNPPFVNGDNQGGW